MKMQFVFWVRPVYVYFAGDLCFFCDRRVARMLEHFGGLRSQGCTTIPVGVALSFIPFTARSKDDMITFEMI